MTQGWSHTRPGVPRRLRARAISRAATRGSARATAHAHKMYQRAGDHARRIATHLQVAKRAPGTASGPGAGRSLSSSSPTLAHDRVGDHGLVRSAGARAGGARHRSVAGAVAPGASAPGRKRSPGRLLLASPRAAGLFGPPALAWLTQAPSHARANGKYAAADPTVEQILWSTWVVASAALAAVAIASQRDDVGASAFRASHLIRPPRGVGGVDPTSAWNCARDRSPEHPD